MADSGNPKDPDPLLSADSRISQSIRPVRFSAVLVGAVVGFLTSLALFGITFLTLLEIGFSEDEIAALGAWPSAILPLLDLIMVTPSVLGGYVAGRRAGYAESRHGLFAAILVCAILVPMEFIDPSPNPAWYDALSYLSAIGAGWLGGSLARRSTPVA